MLQLGCLPRGSLSPPNSAGWLSHAEKWSAMGCRMYPMTRPTKVGGGGAQIRLYVSTVAARSWQQSYSRDARRAVTIPGDQTAESVLNL